VPGRQVYVSDVSNGLVPLRPRAGEHARALSGFHTATREEKAFPHYGSSWKGFSLQPLLLVEEEGREKERRALAREVL